MRLNILKAGVWIGFFFLTAGLFQTQVLKAGYFRNLSENNRIRLIPLEAPRGRVLDRAGRLLATTRPAYHLIATPEDITPEVYPELAHLLKVSQSVVRERMSAPREFPYAPVILMRDIPKELVFTVEELRPELSGVSIQTDWIRSYPYGPIASHLIGYVGKIGPEEYKNQDHTRFGLDSLLGRTGVEKIFDAKLRGWRGGKQIEVNARGERIRVVAEEPPTAGEDVVLTVDLEFQKRITKLIAGKRASVAFLDLKTDELLTMASSPGFDPNVFVSPRSGEARLGFLKDRNSPLLDRGAGAAYPAGSVFKLVTALAGLESGKITPHTTFNCPGYFRLNGRSRTFKCWNEKGHGAMDLYRAIERSCNVYFYNVGRLLGPDLIAKTAREFGLGQSLELELNLTSGLVPDSTWKMNQFKQRWWPGETLSFAVGQSYLQVSPLQVLRLVAIIAKNGEWVEPKLFRFSDSEAFRPQKKKIAIQEKNLKVIRQGMLKVVESDYGTGQLARVDFDQLAGKTGTAQAPPKDPHAWMTGFFPYNDPQVAFVVFIEHGGSGGTTAARIVKQALQIWREMYATLTLV